MIEDMETVLSVLIQYQGRYALTDFFTEQLHPSVQAEIIKALLARALQQKRSMQIPGQWLQRIGLRTAQAEAWVTKDVALLIAIWNGISLD